MVNAKDRIAFLAFLSVFLMLFTSGCAQNGISLRPEPIRYQRISIPDFQKNDYALLLTSKNDEVRYNAICNLVQYAADFGRLLSKREGNDAVQAKTPADKADIENAQHVVEKIRSQLNQANENLKAASLIFLAEFASTYSEKSELSELVLNVRAKKVGTQYEQLNALCVISEPTTSIDPKILNSFLDSDSWIIRSKTCILLAKIDSRNVHERLIINYRTSAHDFDKSLILHAFGNDYGAEVFDLVTHELQEGQSQLLKNYCTDIIKNSENQADAIKWLLNNHRFIGEDLIKRIVESYYTEFEEQKGKNFFSKLLLSGQDRLLRAVNQEAFYKSLYDTLKKQSGSYELAGIEASIEGMALLRNSWINYKSKFDQDELLQEQKATREAHFEQQILPKYNVRLESFLKETEQLFTEGGLDKKEVDEATAMIRELLRYLKKE